MCCFSCWSQMKTAPPLNVILTPALSNQRWREPGSLWTSQKPLRTGFQIQVSFTARFSKKISAKTLVLLNSIYFLFLLLQKIISGWSWASTVPAAPSSHPPTILFPTRARNWRLCLQVCCSCFCFPFKSTHLQFGTYTQWGKIPCKYLYLLIYSTTFQRQILYFLLPYIYLLCRCSLNTDTKYNE